VAAAIWARRRQRHRPQYASRRCEPQIRQISLGAPDPVLLHRPLRATCIAATSWPVIQLNPSTGPGPRSDSHHSAPTAVPIPLPLRWFRPTFWRHLAGPYIGEYRIYAPSGSGSWALGAVEERMSVSMDSLYATAGNIAGTGATI